MHQKLLNKLICPNCYDSRLSKSGMEEFNFYIINPNKKRHYTLKCDPFITFKDINMFHNNIYIGASHSYYENSIFLDENFKMNQSLCYSHTLSNYEFRKSELVKINIRDVFIY